MERLENKRRKITAGVIGQQEISKGIFSLILEHEDFKAALPGQFVNLFTHDEAHLLPRPISISQIDPDKGRITMVYRVAGYGTDKFSRLNAGDEIKAIGPLGNGFWAVMPDGIEEGKKALIIGGGIGIPPMLGLAQSWNNDADVILGFRDETFLMDEFKETGFDIHVSSDTGASGIKGTVIDCIDQEGIAGDIIFACGPKPMLSSVKKLAVERDIPCYLSLEERMACGVGACLGCVVTTENVDEHSKVMNKRVCADGPVFDALEVVL